MSTGPWSFTLPTPRDCLLAASNTIGCVAVGAVSYGSLKWIDSNIRYLVHLKDSHDSLKELDRRKKDFPEHYLQMLHERVWILEGRIWRTRGHKMTAGISKVWEREALALESRLNEWKQEQDADPSVRGKVG